MTVTAQKRYRDPDVAQEFTTLSGIFTRDKRSLFQRFHGPKGDIPEVSDRCCDDIETTHRFSVPFSWRNVIQSFLLAALVLIISILLYSTLKLGSKDYSALANHMAGRSRTQLQLLKPCPLCGTLLSPGERVHTVVYSGSTQGQAQAPKGPTGRPKESLVHMFGCPYCYPPNEQHLRRCPVCTRVIPPDGFVVARMFEKDDTNPNVTNPRENRKKGRKHVHVLGCTVCRPRTLRGTIKHGNNDLR